MLCVWVLGVVKWLSRVYTRQYDIVGSQIDSQETIHPVYDKGAALCDENRKCPLPPKCHQQEKNPFPQKLFCSVFKQLAALLAFWMQLAPAPPPWPTLPHALVMLHKETSGQLELLCIIVASCCCDNIAGQSSTLPRNNWKLLNTQRESAQPLLHDECFRKCRVLKGAR